MRKIVCIASCIIALVALAIWVPNVYAFPTFGGPGQNCKACHAVIFDGGTDNANHQAHSAATGGNCSVCHAPGLTVPPPIANCIVCHGDGVTGAGLREHHRNTTPQTHPCEDCHDSPETPPAENVAPPFYPGPLGLDPCDGSEELFASFTVSLDNDGDTLYDGADPDCATAPTATATATALELTPTGTPTQTATVSTPVSTATASPTGTAPATDTPSPTLTATTPAITVSPSPASTATASATSAGTSTPTPTESAAPTGTAVPSCAGDCNEDEKVAINELIVGVNIALESAELSDCPSFDTNVNQRVDINELVGAVNNALDGCPET